VVATSSVHAPKQTIEIKSKGARSKLFMSC
jgi:hypothetical protein